MESHATFIYQPGQIFFIRGDDDLWVFINDKLVVDLGGLHTPMSDSVDLDKLNLTPGLEYKWDFFFCDRQPCASSLRMKTSIYFNQPRSLYGKSLPGTSPGSSSLEIWKRPGGKGSCAYSDDAGTVETMAANLTYQLLDAKGNIVETLAEGTVHGGITIAASVVTIDTSKITTEVLVPGGTYRIVAFEPTNQALKVEFPFRIPGSSSSLLRRKVPAGKKPLSAPATLLAVRSPPSPTGSILPPSFKNPHPPKSGQTDPNLLTSQLEVIVGKIRLIPAAKTRSFA